MALELIDDFSDYGRTKCLEQIDFMFNKYEWVDWHWLYIALKKKSKRNYETMGFHLWENPGFQAQVRREIERDDSLQPESLEAVLRKYVPAERKIVEPSPTGKEKHDLVRDVLASVNSRNPASCDDDIDDWSF